MIKKGQKVKIVSPFDREEEPPEWYSDSDWEEANEAEGQIGIIKFQDESNLFRVEFEDDDWGDFYSCELEVANSFFKITNTEVFNLQAAIRGMRNPKKSWDKSDSDIKMGLGIGKKDLKLAKSLAKMSGSHRKYLRQIFVSMDIYAPEYWWKEYHTYKVGTDENSTSTMHTIMNSPLTEANFAWDFINDYRQHTLEHLNNLIRTNNFRQLIQDLPSSYLYFKTCSLNYEVLHRMHYDRKNHKLIEWRNFCDWVEGLPHSELITCENN